jgi:IS30 family transposase
MKPQKQYSQLGYEERQTISIGQEQGLSIRAIARMLKRSPSTISREITRNGGAAAYNCRFAQQRHVRKRRHRRPPPKLVAGNALFASVQTLLQQH